MATQRKIVLVGKYGRHIENLAASALSPGHILEVLAAGTVQKQSTEGADAERLVACEYYINGGTIDTAYAADDTVIAYMALPGDEIQAVLKAGENVAAEADLILAGDGTLIAASSAASGSSPKIFAKAKEALDLTASGDVDTKIHVRVL